MSFRDQIFPSGTHVFRPVGGRRGSGVHVTLAVTQEGEEMLSLTLRLFPCIHVSSPACDWLPLLTSSPPHTPSTTHHRQTSPPLYAVPLSAILSKDRVIVPGVNKSVGDI